MANRSSLITAALGACLAANALGAGQRVRTELTVSSDGELARREAAVIPASWRLDDGYELSLAQPTNADTGDDIAAAADSPAGGGGASDLAQKLQNPVADLISVPFQFNYDEGFGPRDASRYTLNIQPVIPIELNEDWNVISRTIIPIIHQEKLADGLDSDTGIGDVVQSFFLSPKEPVGGWIVGVGPVALLPTGTDPQLRSEQLGLGPTAVVLRQEKGWTYGALVNHIWGVTNPDDREEVNATFLQPFLSYTWPTATSLTLNAEMTYDWNEDEWTIPLNLMVGQLTHLGTQPVNFQVGGRYYADAPSGGPEWGLRFAITFLFPK